ncbi:hypothetical protein FJ365_06295 [Candidatus Dependentiae bacterium]|nr:hypothetical protein [Candidatus Dependentiae bacterium]
MNKRRIGVLGILVLSLLTTAGLAMRRGKKSVSTLPAISTVSAKTSVVAKYRVTDTFHPGFDGSSKMIREESKATAASPNSVAWGLTNDHIKIKTLSMQKAAIEALDRDEEKRLYSKIARKVQKLFAVQRDLAELSVDTLLALYKEVNNHLNDITQLTATKMARATLNGVPQHEKQIKTELQPLKMKALQYKLAIKKELAARGKDARSLAVTEAAAAISPESRAAAEGFMRHATARAAQEHQARKMALVRVRKRVVDDDDAPKAVEEDLDGYSYSDGGFESE